MRKVLYRLAWEQLARIIPRTGTMVTPIEFQTMMHAYQARLGIRGEVGRLCAERATKDHLAVLEQIDGDCRALADHRDPGGIVEVDRRLRRVVREALVRQFHRIRSDFLGGPGGGTL